MNRKLTRFLPVFLCAAMVFCLLPWGTVSAAENTVSDRKPAKQMSGMPVQQRSIEFDGESYSFTTFADLQTLAGQSYSDLAYAVYAGSSTLTISKDLYLPEMLVLVVPGKLKVNSGVEFYATYLFANELVVDGTITTAYAEIYDVLDVNGTYYNYYELRLDESTNLTGEANIIHDDYAYGYFCFNPKNMADLKIAANAANASESDSWIYAISFASDMTITEDITLPWNCDVSIEDVDVTVAAGSTLTLGGYAWLYGGLTVNGTLLLDYGALDIYYDYGGLLRVNGTCEGTGYIYVTGSLSDPFDATPGLTGYTSEYNYSDDYWTLIPGADIPGEDINQLGTPTDLGWGYDYETGESVPGCISWKNGIPDRGEFEIQVYRDGEPYEDYLWACVAEDTPQWHSIYNFPISDPSTGEYYFTVTAVDSCGDYSNSPAAMSEKWYYVKPDAALGTCTNLGMDGTKLYWDLPADEAYLGGYQVVVLYSANSADDLFFADYATVYDADNYKSMEFELTQKGYYSFEVRLLSSDINQVCSGEWATLSEPFYYDGNSGNGDNNTGDDNMDPAVSNNTNDHYYINAQRWNDPIKSTLTPEGDGFVRVEYIDGALVVENYDKNLQYISGKTLEMELPVYGGVYMCDDYNFVVLGQNNTEENNAKEVFRIIRYSKDWVRQDSASIFGANTIAPFDSGCVRFDRSGDILYIRTSHKMYTSSDGLNHQANVMIAVRISDMTVTDQFTDVLNVNYGYVSHSFNQFVRVDGTDLLAVDHGDYYPRSVVLIKYGAPAGRETFYGKVSYVNALPIVESTYHYNDTGVSVGGFECSSTDYLIAGSSYDQIEPADLRNVHRNIFVTATPKNDFTDEATTVHWITNYTASDNVEVSPPYLVKLETDRFFLVWTENGVLKYCFLNGKGELEGEIITGKGALSDCVPVLDGDRIVWYVTNNSTPVFYEISVNAIHAHDYISSITTAPTCTADGIITYTCACGDSYTETLPATGHQFAGGQCSVCGLRPGDLNADGTVDDSDVALLLWHTLFPDSYTVSGNADFTGDGNINDADVAYLLWHTLFPDAYPL